MMEDEKRNGELRGSLISYLAAKVRTESVKCESKMSAVWMCRI